MRENEKHVPSLGFLTSGFLYGISVKSQFPSLQWVIQDNWKKLAK